MYLNNKSFNRLKHLTYQAIFKIRLTLENKYFDMNVNLIRSHNDKNQKFDIY